MNEEDEQGATDSRPFESGADGAAEARGQIIEYATEVMRNQPRLFCFMTVVAGCHARFLRWDRWGAIVSESFNFVRNKEIMFEFLYNYGAMTQAERGYDPKVIPATDSEIREMMAWKTTIMRDEGKRLSSYQEKCFDEAMSGKWSICKVFVPKEDIIPPADLGPKETDHASAALEVADDARNAADNPLAGLELIVGRPLHASRSLIDRSTKAHVAYDMKNNRLVFMKTSWRAESTKVPAERDTYIHLWSHGVRHIARPVSAGDVSSDGVLQRTLTQTYAKREQTAVGRIHYRLVIDEVYEPMETYLHPYEMVVVLSGALIAHEDAWTKAHVLHRDISVNNVMIKRTGPEQGQVIGILIDWDLCKHEKDIEKGVTQASRSGTWQFMSALLLVFPKKVHRLSDDLESFVHLLHWLIRKR